jgi:hypothetical protein
MGMAERGSPIYFLMLRAFWALAANFRVRERGRVRGRESAHLGRNAGAPSGQSTYLAHV